MMMALELDTVPVYCYMQLAGGRAHERLNEEQFHILIERILEREEGNDVAAEIVGMRAFGRRSDNLQISESLKATCRYVLSISELSKGDRGHVDHMFGEIIQVAFDKQEHEKEGRDFCIKILEGLKNWKITEWDVGDSITALIKTIPITVLDILVEQDSDEEGNNRSVFQDIRGNRVCPLDLMDDVIWMDWVAQKPESRASLLARVVQFSNTSNDEHSDGWSPAALKLIDAALEPKKILDIFLARFEPNRWSGSFADTLASRMPLIEVLKEHSNSEIVEWADKHAPEYAVYV